MSDNTAQPCVHANLHLSGMTEVQGGIGSWYECQKCGECFRSDVKPYKLKVAQGVPAQTAPPVTAQWRVQTGGDSLTGFWCQARTNGSVFHEEAPSLNEAIASMLKRIEKERG